MLDEELHKEKDNFIYDNAYKTSAGAKPLRIRFNKVDESIKTHDKISILYYLIIVIAIKFVRRLIILEMKKVVLQIVLIIILQESDLIHINFYL